MAEEREGSWDLKWELLVADAWSDPELKKRLLADPTAVCAERGIALPKGRKIKVIEDSDTVTHFVLPSKPAGEELSEEALESVAGGGGCFGCFGCLGCGGCGGCGCRGCGGCGGCRGCGGGCRGCGGCGRR
jgi:hypothetical protein